MGWTRAELKERAKASLRAFYWKSVLVAFVMGLLTSAGGSAVGNGADEAVDDSIIGGPGAMMDERALAALGSFLSMAMSLILISSIIGLLLVIFVWNPLTVGCMRYFLDASDGDANLGNMGYAFKNNYLNLVGVMFLKDLFIALWSMLFIIPGIWKSYQYRMIPYLLAEDPALTFTQAKELSIRMMDGEKWNAFVLDISFFLWAFLSALTLNIVGIFWVNPYVAFTDVELYKVLRVRVPGPYYVGNDAYGQYMQ